MGTPYFRHVLNVWEKRHHPNMHIIFYEDMKLVFIVHWLIACAINSITFIVHQNLRGEIQKAADYLGKKLAEEDLDKLENHLHISSFEKNEAVNNERLKMIGIANEGGKFIRKGNITKGNIFLKL